MIWRIFIVVKYSIALCLHGIIAKTEKCQILTMVCDRHNSNSSPGFFLFFLFFFLKLYIFSNIAKVQPRAINP